MTKTISLSDRAYTYLKTMKKPGESFSDVVISLIERKKKPSIEKLFGVWKGDKKVEKIYNEILELRHKSKVRTVDF